MRIQRAVIPVGSLRFHLEELHAAVSLALAQVEGQIEALLKVKTDIRLVLAEQEQERQREALVAISPQAGEQEQH